MTDGTFTSTAHRAGVFARWRSRLFGDRDPVEQQLADIAKQGAGPARVAHVCSTALVVLFSAASFVALGSDTLATIQAQWRTQHTLNVPDAISLSVITLMVLAFDVGMVYAASMLRTLATRRAGWDEKWVHVLVMVGVAAIEASTYTYMAWRFERPQDGIAWALIIMRAVASPLLAVYLSMARALPVTARDILAQAELASGAGVIRDVTVRANDRGAPLEEKMEMYGASAVMTPVDRTRLDTMIKVVQRRRPTVTIVEAVPTFASPLAEPDVPTLAQMGLGSHIPGSNPSLPEVTQADTSKVVSFPTPRKRRTAAKGQSTQPKAKASVEERVRAVWTPSMSVKRLARAAHISDSTASKWNHILGQEEGAKAQ